MFDYLSTQGKLTINGRDYEFWQGLHNTLVNGGAFKICMSSTTAKMILREINFYSGKRYKITSGDSLAKMEGTVEGNSLNEIIDSLMRTRGVTVAEN